MSAMRCARRVGFLAQSILIYHVINMMLENTTVHVLKYATLTSSLTNKNVMPTVHVSTPVVTMTEGVVTHKYMSVGLKKLSFIPTGCLFMPMSVVTVFRSHR